MSTYKITTDQQEFSVKTDELSALDIHKISAEKFHVLKDNQAYKVALISENFLDKSLTLSVNGNLYDLKIDDAYDMMVSKMGLLEKTESKSTNIKAPMPGIIVDILVKPGDSIEDNTPLFILSAMKMENTILSDGKGVVKSIEVNINDAVDKGQLIIEMEA
ncbi:pyruvate carboxylase [unidentified eubacterium SCB49]|nr:pyruvate carboxylase [unidentified eubacterium SCB49]